MSESGTESIAEVEGSDHVEEGQATRKDDTFVSMGLQVLSGEISDFDPDGDDARPFDVVAVHGIHGDRHTSWGGPNNNWLEDQLFAHYASSRVLTFGYDTHGSKGVFTRAGIREKAIQLLDELVKLRKPSEPDLFRPLVFIGHDLGGIIVKEAICIAALEYQKYRTIVNWARLFIFFGCPHRSTSTQNMEDVIGNLLYAGHHPRPVGALRTIKDMSRSIVEINGSFILAKIPTVASYVDLYSDEEDPKLQIFDKYTASLGIPLGIRIARDGPHKDICSTVSEDLYEEIDTVLESYPKPSEYNNATERSLRNFQALSAIVYPLESKYGPDRSCSWISDHETYTSFFESHGPNLLYVHGTTGTPDAFEYLFQHLNSNTTIAEPVLYFRFDKYDDQRNSVAGMLSSLLAQVYTHLPVYHTVAYLSEETLAFYHSWTVLELFNLFRNFCTNLSHSSCFVMIGGLEYCDEPILGFLKDMCNFAGITEYKFKIVLTSTTNSSFQSALAEWPTINLNDHSLATDDSKQKAEVEFELLQLVQEFPALHNFETLITEKLFKCGQDHDWRRLVLKEIRGLSLGSRMSAIQRKLDLVQVISPSHTLQGILSRIPSERQLWARKVLMWIVYSFRPLSVWELAIALSPEYNSISDTPVSAEVLYGTLTADIDDIFGEALIIKHNQVCFGHSAAREFFMASELLPDKQSSAHEILDTCQKYLSSEQVQASLVALYINPADDMVEPPIFTHRYNLIEYAVKYWPKHFKIAAENSPSKEDLEFAQNTKVMKTWAKAYWCLSNSFHRRDRGDLSVLSLFAGLGLQSLVKELLAIAKTKSPEASQDRGLALIEATRYDQAEIVRMLLTYGNYNEAVLRDSLFAATAANDEAILDLLVTHIGKTIDKFDWPSTTLLRASQFGYARVVRKLLEFGASPDKETTIGINNWTPIYVATTRGHIEVVKILLEFKVNVDQAAVFQRTALHAACSTGNEHIAELLISAGADINALDVNSNTPVILAVQWGSFKAAEVMVKHGCILDNICKGETIRTPMTIAADLGFIKCARIMLENKASPEVVCKSNWTPLRYTVAKGNIEFTRLLLDCGADPNTTVGGEPLLGNAASDGMLEIVKLLVEHGATIDTVSSVGWTALHRAASKGNDEVVSYLLDHGASINARASDGGTPLLFAASNSKSDTVKVLLDKGTDVHMPANNNWSPIQYSYDHGETARLLMEAGADANRVTDFYVPLHLAAIKNHVEVVRVLVSYPIDLEVEFLKEGSQKGYSSLDFAVYYENKEIIKLLLEAGANVNHLSARNCFCLQYAVGTGDPSILRMVMEYNPKLDHQDDDGDTAVGFIRESAPLEIYQILVNGGASLDIPNKQFCTPICAAAKAGRMELVKYFISKKANLDHGKAVDGGPLHVACRRTNVELVELLVKAGADVNLLNDGTPGTPLQTVGRCWDGVENRDAQEKIVRYLVNEGKADVNVIGGKVGCALNAMCGWSSADMVKLLLEEGAKTDVVDEMGRTVIHFAALQSLENLQLIMNTGADIDVKDLMGRSAMHWAVVSGSPDVVERVLSLSRRLLDQPDNDGWTPLLWAARGCATYYKTTTAISRKKIINFLLDHGADPLVKGRGLDREWTLIQVARYHNLDDELIQLFIQKTKDKLGAEELYHEAEHACLKAADQGGVCDSCDCTMLGNRYKCNDCLDFDFCYKCYKSRFVIHNKDHTFRIIGPEFDPVIEVEKEEDDDDDDDTDEDTDDDTEDDKDEEGKKDNNSKSDEVKVVNDDKTEESEEEEDSDDSDSS